MGTGMRKGWLSKITDEVRPRFLAWLAGAIVLKLAQLAYAPIESHIAEHRALQRDVQRIERELTDLQRATQPRSVP